MKKQPKAAEDTTVPLPPANAKVVTTVCDYCIVGCGYKVYVWPEGVEGGPAASENALAVDFPVEQMTGQWISPNAHGQCVVDGQKHRVAIIADPDAAVVNRGGNHSIRGGCLAKKVYSPDGPTKDRLSQPLMRVAGKLQPVSWDLALNVMAKVSQHVIDKHGTPAWGMKTFSYQYFENTYAISKLAFESIKTPAYAPHDKPGPGNDTAGIDDTGFVPFSASYDDWAKADVIFISGSDPYESKTIVFTDWMMQGDKKIIMVMPRKTTGAAYAEKNGGLFLPIIPGTDTILHLALARLVLENGWQDDEFLANWVANRWEIDSGFGRGTRNTPWQWRTTWGKLGASFDEYKKWLFSQPESELTTASRLTGIDEALIRKAAELIAKPIDGVPPKTSFALEKGNYWSNNYLNTASFGTLAAICGAGNRDGRVVSRLGGHQRGWYAAASYPRIYSPEKGPGRRKMEIDLDRWVESGNLRFAWVIGTTWCQAMAASQELMAKFESVTKLSKHQIATVDQDHAIDVLKKRVDDGGMFVVHQDIYLRQPIGSDFADLVLPTSFCRLRRGVNATSAAAMVSAAYGCIVNFAIHRAMPSRIGGLSPNSRNVWVSKITIGKTPTMSLNRPPDSVAKACSIFIRWFTMPSRWECEATTCFANSERMGFKRRFAFERNLRNQKTTSDTLAFLTARQSLARSLVPSVCMTPRWISARRKVRRII